MVDEEFGKCPVCGSYPNIKNKGESWELSCKCGKIIPGCKSREQLLRGWNRVLKQAEEDAPKRKRGV